MSLKEHFKNKEYKWQTAGGLAVGLIAVIGLMFYRLGSLMPGLSSNESSLLTSSHGWHSLYQNPLNLPLNALWSTVFKLLSPVSQFWLRSPAALIGCLTVAAFFILLRYWFGLRTAAIGAVLFATSAWTLHVSRLASYDIEYLGAMVFFLLTTAVLQKRYQSRYVYWLVNLAWSILVYVPGMVFFIGYNIYRQHGEIGYGMKLQKSFSSKLAYVFSGLIWLPLLGRYVIKAPSNILYWLGLPRHFASPWHIVKEFGAVFYHIFVRGPLLPQLWLGRSPILDIFGVITALAGVYFYVTHVKATRTHLVFVNLLIGSILIAVGGGVSLSIVMPIIYILIATGIAYLTSQWLAVFPKNPLARGLGYFIIILAVAASVAYNIRSYFIAWPHSSSVSVFEVKDKD